MAVLAPIFLALSAGAPIFRGFLSDIDARWTVISQSVDDRTAVERGEEGSGRDGERRIAKSRYDSISHFLGSKDGKFDEAYNDIEIEYDEKFYKRLLALGLDERMAKHFAHVIIILDLYFSFLSVFFFRFTHSLSFYTGTAFHSGSIGCLF